MLLIIQETSDATVVEVSIGRTVQSLHLLLTGFEDENVSPLRDYHPLLVIVVLQEEYFSVAEINVRAMVLDGYYFPGPHHVRAEAESGVVMGSQVFKIRSDAQEFPGYSGSGYTVLNYPISTNVSRATIFYATQSLSSSLQPYLQLMVPVPQTASYKLVARFISTQQGSHPMYGTLQQSGGATRGIVFRLNGSGACSQPCYVEATLQDDPSDISDFALSGDQTATIILSLERTGGNDGGTPILLVRKASQFHL